MQDVSRAHPCFKIVLTSVPCLLVDEIGCGDRLSQNGRRQMVKSEQTIVVSMKNVVREFFKLHVLVLDAFAGTLSSMEVCLFLENNRLVVECEKDVFCLQNCMSRFVEL